MPRYSSLPVSVLLAIPLLPGPLRGAEEGDPVSCISLSRIDHTEVIDSRHIAFHMKDNEILVNTLDRECPRLSDKRPFSYRTSTGQLCNIDLITVLEDSAFGFARGASCPLGKFEPADEDVLAILRGEAEPVEVTGREIKPDE